MAKQHLHALVVNLLCAFHIVLLLEVWKLFSEALLVEVLFGVASLVLNDVIGHLDFVEASLLARSADTLLVASVEAVVVSSLDDAAHALLEVVQLSAVESLFGFHF